MKKIISIVLSLVMLVFCFAIGASAAPLRTLDLAFVVDTTGSMSGDIYQVKTDMKDYLDDLDASGMNYRIAIVDYRDFPERASYGDYPYNVQLDFTNDYDAILAAINGLTLGGGGDGPETIYSALIDGLDELSWRTSAGKAAIVMGDAPALDPEPFTGYTRADVVEKMKTGKIGVDGEEYKAIRAASDVERTPITLFTIATSSYSEECFEALATETGGKSYTAENSAEVTDAIVDIIEEIPEIVEPGEEDDDDDLGLFGWFIDFIAIIIYIVTFQWLF